MLHKKNPLWLATTLAATAWASQATAQDRSPPLDQGTALDTLQVTANRLPQTQADVLASTTLIDRDEIERSQAGSLVGLLQGRAGIELTQNGANGGVTSLFLRGSESNHSVVLIDGVRINSAVNGGTSLELLPLAAIERIEIVRGPRAASYGADAIGGVIQIFTRQADDEGLSGSASAHLGDNGDQHQSARVATGNASTQLSASLFQRDDEGFNTKSSDTSGEEDGYRSEGGQLGLSHRFSDTVQGELSLLRQDFEAEYDDCYRTGDYSAPASNDCLSEGYQQSVAGSLAIDWQPDATLTLSAGHFDEVRKEHYEGERQSRTATERDEVGLQQRWFQDQGAIAVGIDYRDEGVDYEDRVGSQYERDRRDNLGLYATAQREFGDHQLSGSLRHDDDSLFGGETTGNLAYGYRLTPTQQLGASVGTAFKAPSLQDLYGTFSPNPDLEAETSKNLEAFWSYRRGNTDARITAFENRIEELITYVDSTTGYVNVDEARIRGIELEGGWQRERLSARLSVTVQDPKVERWSDAYAGIEAGDRLLSRAERFARLDMDYRLSDAFSTGATLLGASERTAYGGEDVAGYGVIDLHTAWQVTPMVELSAKLENVFDKQYELVDGYNTRDRYLEGGVTLFF